MANPQEQILVIISDAQLGLLLNRLLSAAGYAVTIQPQASAGRLPPAVAIVHEPCSGGQGQEKAVELLKLYPNLPVILLLEQDTPDLLKFAMRLGIADCIALPLRADELVKTVKRVLERSRQYKEAVLLESSRQITSLQRRLDEQETIMRLARLVTSSLKPDSVLTAVVKAAVELTGAEEGSLLLIDPATGELYMRAARNFHDDFVRTFRLPIVDSLAGDVIRSGEPVLLNESSPQKIKTSYLVYSLLYVPLKVNGHVFGVLGVDNRHNHQPLTEKHIHLLNMLAGFAVIALENARAYTEIISECSRFESILNGIQDGVVVVDPDGRLGLVNPAARQIFGLEAEASLSGRLFQDVFPQEVLLDLLRPPDNRPARFTEYSPDGERFLSVQLTLVEDVGSILVLHDVTHLKQLDRIKTDFVHTVSHDLRSPLTAILGYVELIERAGPVTDLQRDFIRRVQTSVRNITSLIDNLLILGRIESGFDTRKDKVLIDALIHHAAGGLKQKLADKGHHLQIRLDETPPALLANPVQMRQMMEYLLGNAIDYTPGGGTVAITGKEEQGQVILQVSDTGIGIPASELPFIFDKFYRASNASTELAGTGLGLAIVRSIVDNHGGRIWVESEVGKGSTFTVVLPVAPS